MNPVRPTVWYASHCLGGYDGVSVEAARWISHLTTTGFRVVRVAGMFGSAAPARSDDLLLPFWVPSLAANFADDPSLVLDRAALDRRLDYDPPALVILDNLGTLPGSLPKNAVEFVAALEERRTPMILRHHDPAWDDPGRRRSDHRFPLAPARASHVAITSHIAAGLEAHLGIKATVVHNPIDEMDVPSPRERLVERAAARTALGIDRRTVLLLHPVTPYDRKDVPTNIAIAARLASREPDRPVCYWLTGGSDDDREALLGNSRPPNLEVRVGRINPRRLAYAAADAVLLASTWEGWGNPAAEGAAAGLPTVVGSWPATADMRDLGAELITLHGRDEPSIDAGTGLLQRQMSDHQEAERLAAAADRVRASLAPVASTGRLDALVEGCFRVRA